MNLTKESKMTIKNKRIVPLAFLSFAGAYLLTFLTIYVSTFIKSDILGTVVEYIGYYMLSAIDFITPAILAAIVLVLYAYCSTSTMITSAFLIAAASTLYVLPTTYLEYVYTYGSVEAIIFALSGSVRAILFILIGVFASVWASTFVLGRVLHKTHTEVKEYLPELLHEKSSTDFLKPANLPILVFVLIRFVIELIKEIVYTVTFFITYGSDYSGTEIFTMLFNYVWLFTLLVAAYILVGRIKDALCRFAVKEESSTEDLTVE